MDEVGEVAEKLPERGVFALGEGTAPGGAVVLWFGAGGLTTGAEGIPLRGVEAQIGGESQPGGEQQIGRHPQPEFGQFHGVPRQRDAEAQFGVQPRFGLDEQRGVRQQHGAETPIGGHAPREFDEQHGGVTPVGGHAPREFDEQHGGVTPVGGQAPRGFEEQHGAGQQHGAEAQRAELPGGAPPRAPEPWKPDHIADAGTEYHSTSAGSRDRGATGPRGAEQRRTSDLRKQDDLAEVGTEYYSASPVSREPEASGPTGGEQQYGFAPQQVPDLRKRDDLADAATEQYGASAVSRKSDAASSMTPPRTQIPPMGGVAESQGESSSSANPVVRGPQVPPMDAVAEQSSGSSPAVGPAQPHDRVLPPSTPRLPKPVGTGQSESVAHSGAQHGIVRPESVAAQHFPDHPAARDADLEETVVPGEALAPRVRDGGVVAESRGVVVKGFKCARDHLNDPRVSFCAVCGIRMDQLTCILTDGIRPPLGLLLLDDGTSFVLDNDCVLGREPEHAEAVARGARPVRVEDHSGGMSRAHAEIRLIDWDVTVVDGGSTNGTHIRQPGHQDWTRAIPGHPVKLTPGAQIQLGGRVATFDSQHGQL
ncbi:FHA domain-containing protein [Nocardia ninae]